MPVWKESRGWRYRFQFKGKFYRNNKERNQPGFYRTKGEAQAAEAEHRKELKAAEKARTRTGMVFSELANEYLDWSYRRHATKTYKYKAYVFREFMAFSGDLEVDKITTTVLESYLKTRRTNTNYNRHRKDLCTLLAWGWRRKLLAENPCFFVEKLPEPQQQKVIPTPQEMARLFVAAGPEKSLLLVLYHTLARIDEILRLRWEDVSFEERYIRLWTRKRKGGEWGSDTLPMNQVLYDTLWNLWQKKEQNEWVFLNPKTGTRYMHRPKLMRTLCKRAGIRHFGFHAIRHYVASLLHDSKKVSLSQVSKLLRHQTKATTEKYLQVIDPTSRAAMEALEDGFLEEVPKTPSQ